MIPHELEQFGELCDFKHDAAIFGTSQRDFFHFLVCMGYIVLFYKGMLLVYDVMIFYVY